MNHTLNNEQWQTRKEKAVAKGQGNLAQVYVDSGKNAELWDVEGKRYIDFGTGIAVCNTGHSHPKVVNAIKQQVEKLSHSCVMVTPYGNAVELAEQLNEKAPIAGECKSIFVTTGAESVENTIKIARAYTGRRGVIAFTGGFHGRTNMAMALTGKVMPYKRSFGPFPSDIFHAQFPVDYHEVSIKQALHSLHQLFKCDVDARDVAAIIIEPIQGEGGFYVAPTEFLVEIRKICDEHGIVLIADEIQSGFARTGKFFAIEHTGVEPDLITVAKGIAGGFPIAAVVGKAHIMDAAHPGGLGGTYGGSPIGCAAAIAVLDVIKEEELLTRATQLGALFGERLRKMQENHPDKIGQVRAERGCMLAIELVKHGDFSQPDQDLTKYLISHAYANGLVLLSCGVNANVIRILPALTMEDHIAHEGLDILEGIVESYQQ
jgi:4-aminobutyrate aminotransferase/(S)-3-amino-2-methylpropionate transaminase